MASVTLEHIKKEYENHVVAVHDFNLRIRDKEFIVFVGPSGCGKSTTLRMVAGLEDISGGTLKIGDRGRDAGVYSATQGPAAVSRVLTGDGELLILEGTEPGTIIYIR